MGRKKIDKITDQERVALEKFAEVWVAKSRCTDPADRAMFEENIGPCYKFAGIQEPTTFVWVQSPVVALFAGPITDFMVGLANTKKGTKGAGEKISSASSTKVIEKKPNLPSGSADAMNQNLVNLAKISVGLDRQMLEDVEKFGGVFSDKGTAANALPKPIRQEIYRASREAFLGVVERELKNMTQGEAADFFDRILSTREKDVTSEIRGKWNNYLGGTCWLGWAAYLLAMKEVLDLELPGDLWERNDRYIKVLQSSGHSWPGNGFVIVSERPSRIDLESTGGTGWGSLRLHRNDGPALEYRDGWGVCRIHGVAVPRWLVDTPAEKLDPMEFAKLDNVEVRREFLRKIGADRLAQKLGARTLDKQGPKSGITDPEFSARLALLPADQIDDRYEYELLALNLGGSTGEWPYLKMTNPSIGVFHMEAVPKECKTVAQALAFRDGGLFRHIAPIT